MSLGLGLRLPLAGGRRDPYPGASVALDFAGVSGLKSFYKASGIISSTFANLPNLTVNRASGGYAEDTSGNLIWFNSGQARITNKGLLVEEARTNLFLQSQTFDNASWSGVSTTTVSANAALAPDGTQTADRLTSIAAMQPRVEQAPTGFAITTTYAVAAYVKPGTATHAGFGWYDGTVNNFISFDLAKGVYEGVTGSAISNPAITRAANGWFRISANVTTGASVTGVSGIKITYGDVAILNQVTTATVGVYLDVWQADAQLGSFITSPIPTTASTVTRAADDIRLGGMSFLSGMTALVDALVPSGTLTADRWLLQQGVGQPGLKLYYLTSGGVSPSIPSTADGTATPNAAVGQFRVAASFVNGTQQVSANGVTGTAAAIAYTPAATTLYLAQSSTQTNVYNGYIRALVLYPSALSQAQLNALTSGTDPSTLRLDFASGVYKNAAGYVRTNLLLQSRALGTAPWSPNTVTVTNNAAVAPDGTTTATQLAATGADSYIIQPTTALASLNRTFSVWLKSASGNVTMNIGIGVTYQSITVTPTWQRFWITNASSNDRVIIGGVSSFTTGQTIYAWEGQIELVNYPTSNITTTSAAASTTTYSSTNPADVGNLTFTRASTSYGTDSQGNLILFPANVPVITDRGLQVEESRTNLVFYSNDQSNAQWTTAGTCTVTANVGVAPDGTTTAAQLVSNAGNGRYSNTPSLANATTYTSSAYFKLVSGGPNIQFVAAGQGVFGGAGGDRSVVFDGNTGAFVSKSTEISAYTITRMVNGWFRVTATFTTTSVGNSAMALYAGSNAATYYTWGAQIELGAFATSLTPTTSASATRAADVFGYTGLATASVGTYAARYLPTNFGNYRRVISGPTGGNSVSPLLMDAGATGKMQAYDAAILATTAVPPTLNALNTAAMRYDGTNVSVSGNGGAIATSAGGASFPTQTALYFGGNNGGASSDTLNGLIVQTARYGYAASDNELIYRSAGNF